MTRVTSFSLLIGVLSITGCSSATLPPSSPPSAPVAQAPAVVPTPTSVSSTDVLRIGLSRPTETPDPFSPPDRRFGPPPIAPKPEPPVAHTPVATRVAIVPRKPVPAPSARPPVELPNYKVAGIFRSAHGVEALLSSQEGSRVVRPGERLKPGAFVRSIDPVGRQVVIGTTDRDVTVPFEENH